jgi:hypothetical protein
MSTFGGFQLIQLIAELFPFGIEPHGPSRYPLLLLSDLVRRRRTAETALRRPKENATAKPWAGKGSRGRARLATWRNSYALLPIGYPYGRFGPVRRKVLANVVYEDRWGQPYRDL